MSVKVMAHVWAHSWCAGTELLTVLALADWADDDGWSWPSLPKLAKKTRVTVSQLCKPLTAIEERTGEIYRERSTGGRNRRTRYRVAVTENSVVDNSVAGNSVVENSVIHAPKTVSPTRGALIHHRSVNKSNGANAPDSTLKTTPKKKKTPDATTLTALEAFYRAYPRRTKKKPALDAWLKLNPDADLITVIMAAVERYAAVVRDADSKYIAHPSTWLHEERWTDESTGTNG